MTNNKHSITLIIRRLHMITIEDIANKAGLTRTAVMYRIKQLGNLPVNYGQGARGGVRIYTEDDLQAIINYKPRKPGPKEKPWKV